MPRRKSGSAGMQSSWNLASRSTEESCSPESVSMVTPLWKASPWQAWIKKTFGFPASELQFCAVKAVVSSRIGTSCPSTPYIMPFFPWDRIQHTKQSLSSWSLLWKLFTVSRIPSAVRSLYSSTLKWSLLKTFLRAAGKQREGKLETFHYMKIGLCNCKLHF